MSEMGENVSEQIMDGIDASDARARKLLDLRAGNKELLARVRARGGRVDTTRLRLEALIEAILEPEDRLEFELFFESKVRDGLLEGEQVLNRAALLKGVPK